MGRFEKGVLSRRLMMSVARRLVYRFLPRLDCKMRTAANGMSVGCSSSRMRGASNAVTAFSRLCVARRAVCHGDRSIQYRVRCGWPVSANQGVGSSLDWTLPGKLPAHAYAQQARASEQALREDKLKGDSVVLGDLGL